MKKILILLTACLVLMAVGCSSGGDDGPQENTENNNEGGEEGLTGDPFIDFPDNFQGAGDSANDLLSNTEFDALRVEIAFAPGFRPTEATLENFKDFLLARTFKPDVEYVFTTVPPSEEESFTLQEVAALEVENRTVYNDGTTLGVYIYFADAPNEGDEEAQGLVTVGAVYRNTSMVIYESTIRTLAGRRLSITLTDVETATLNHEFGHLFGLVNLGTVPVNDHEDPDALNHCNVDGCLMQAELQFGAARFLRGNALASKSTVRSACSLSGKELMNTLESRAANNLAVVPDLDPECILDLQNNGGQ